MSQLLLEEMKDKDQQLEFEKTFGVLSNPKKRSFHQASCSSKPLSDPFEVRERVFSHHQEEKSPEKIGMERRRSVWRVHESLNRQHQLN